jgi:hypothetical protein
MAAASGSHHVTPHFASYVIVSVGIAIAIHRRDSKLKLLK